ncbi:MAG: hypothetical protein AABW51_02085 [Nanoarchaeota archaeon]
MLNPKIIGQRKAQMFTITAILLIALVFASFEIFSILHERAAIKERVHSMDNFLKSLEKNMQRQMYISGYRILFLANQETATKLTYINNFNSFSQEAFFNGSVDGIPSNITIGTTYADVINSINQKAAKINVNVVLNNTVFSITQNDPWNVRVSMVSDFVMTDVQGLALWNKKQNISVLILVDNFEDPLFAVGSGGKITRKIKQTIYEGNYVTGSNSSNFTNHFIKGYYASNPSAPSFLMRLEGNFSANPNGIESFVIKEALIQQGVSVDTYKDSLDYIYFDPSNNPYKCYPTTPPESYFRIDLQHLAKYNLTSLYCS